MARVNVLRADLLEDWVRSEQKAPWGGGIMSKDSRSIQSGGFHFGAHRLVQHFDALPRPWDVNKFIARVAECRQRDIWLLPVENAGRYAGSWHAEAHADVITYAAHAQPQQQDQTILHQFGHLVLGHRNRCVLELDEVHYFTPLLAPAAYAHLLGGDEGEADAIATLLLDRIAARTGLSPPPVPPCCRSTTTRRTGADQPC